MLVRYAVFWYLTIAFESGVIMILAALFGVLPQAAISIFGGVWADRHNRMYMIMGADGASAERLGVPRVTGQWSCRPDEAGAPATR